MATAAKPPTMKPKMDKPNGIWARILIPVGVLAVAGAVAWGQLRQEVTGLAEHEQIVHPKVTQNCQDIAVLKSELREMNRKLDRIIRNQEGD